MDARQVLLQLNLIRVTYRGEAARLDDYALRAYRDRARGILDALEADAGADKALMAQIESVRREIDA